MSAGRITYDDDGASLDEIVLEGVTFHMERMSHHGWWMSIRTDDGQTDLHINLRAMAEPMVEDEGADPYALVPEVCEPLLFHDGSLWTDELGVEHRCEVDSGLSRERVDASPHRKCRCECGATRSRKGHRDRQGRCEALDESEGEA